MRPHVLDYAQSLRAQVTLKEGRIVLRREGSAVPFYLSRAEAFALAKFVKNSFFYEDWAAAFSRPECDHDWIPPQSGDEWEFCRLCQITRLEYEDGLAQAK